MQGWSFKTTLLLFMGMGTTLILLSLNIALMPQEPAAAMPPLPESWILPGACFLTVLSSELMFLLSTPDSQKTGQAHLLASLLGRKDS